MEITMVKKRMPDGSECDKCGQSADLLKKRGYWDRVTRVIFVEDPADPNDEGMSLARELNVKRAPFFVVQNKDGSKKPYDSVLRLVKEVLEPGAGPTAS